jgi:hypothetical protein
MSFKIDPKPGAEIQILDMPQFPFQHFVALPQRRLVPCSTLENDCPLCEITPPRVQGMHEIVAGIWIKTKLAWTESGPEWRTVMLSTTVSRGYVWFDTEGSDTKWIRGVAEEMGVGL